MVDQSFGTSDILLRDEITSTLKILFERTKQKRARTIPKKTVEQTFMFVYMVYQEERSHLKLFIFKW